MANGNINRLSNVYASANDFVAEGTIYKVSDSRMIILLSDETATRDGGMRLNIESNAMYFQIFKNNAWQTIKSWS